MASMGIPTPRLAYLNVEASTLETGIWRSFLNLIMSPRGDGTQQLSVRMEYADVDTMEGVGLAMVHSPSLREVDFVMGVDNERGVEEHDFERWLWATYALFSNEASHDIRTVSLNMLQLDMSFIQRMQAIISHDDPLACLYACLGRENGYPARIQSTASAVVLRPSAMVHCGGHRDANDSSDEHVEIELGVAYRVVRNDPAGEWIEFALPGLGICWTHRSEIVEMRPVLKRDRHSVRHLQLYHVTYDGDPDAAIAFIQLVGEPIERLTLHDLSLFGEHSDEFFESILSHLPNLKCLELQRCRLEGLDFLLSRGTRLESLRLDDVNLSGDDVEGRRRRDPASWVNFMAALSDPTNSLALSLRELHISLRPHSDDELAVGSPESIFAMLKRNKRLLRCALQRQRRGSNPPWWSHDFMVRDGELLPIGPLPPAETLAFLSAVTADSATETTAKARCKLDTESLRLILELAALRPRRTCMVLMKA